MYNFVNQFWTNTISGQNEIFGISREDRVKMEKITKLANFLKEYYGEKYELYLKNLNFQALEFDYEFDHENGAFEDFSSEIQENLKEKADIKHMKKKLEDGFLCYEESFDRLLLYLSLTPLHLACEIQDKEMIHLLLEMGADPNTLDFLGSTAAMNVNVDVESIKLFLTYGLDPNIINAYYALPSDLFCKAIVMVSPELAKILIDYGYSNFNDQEYLDDVKKTIQGAREIREGFADEKYRKELEDLQEIENILYKAIEDNRNRETEESSSSEKDYSENEEDIRTEMDFDSQNGEEAKISKERNGILDSVDLEDIGCILERLDNELPYELLKLENTIPNNSNSQKSPKRELEESDSEELHEGPSKKFKNQ